MTENAIPLKSSSMPLVEQEGDLGPVPWLYGADVSTLITFALTHQCSASAPSL